MIRILKVEDSFDIVSDDKIPHVAALLVAAVDLLNETHRGGRFLRKL